jgi:hypothetical protein
MTSALPSERGTMTELKPRWTGWDIIVAFFSLVLTFIVLLLIIIPRWFPQSLSGQFSVLALSALVVLPLLGFILTLLDRDQSGRPGVLIIPELWSNVLLPCWRYFFGTNNNPFVGPLRVVGWLLLVIVFNKVYYLRYVTWSACIFEVSKGEDWSSIRDHTWFWESSSVGPIDMFRNTSVSEPLFSQYLVPGIVLLLLARNLNKLKSVDK